MMNTYILPVDDDGELYIESVTAKDFEQATDKYINVFEDMFDVEASDWDDLVVQLAEKNVRIGDIYDIEEF